MDQLIQDMLTLTLAAGLSSLIGFERESSHRPAGLRTHVLVCIGSTMLTLVALSTFGLQADKIIQGIVTGIGFLGAGSIIASGRHIQGITTAATIWVTAILGIIVATGHYVFSLFATAIILLVLSLKKFENKLRPLDIRS
jgi:putative Mg2+ transporter-C (MgtC) family protein